MNDIDLSIVIPCYRSEKTLEVVVKEIQETISQRPINYEIILVNDCSPDGVWNVIKRLSADNDNIHGVSFSKNFGQHSALMAGYRIAKGKYVLSLDDDGQTPANELFKLIDKIDEGYDVVYASYSTKKHTSFRNFGTKVNNIMCEKLLGKPKGIVITSYFIARLFVIKEICNYYNPYTYIIGLILRTTNNIGTVPVTHRSRLSGESGYSFIKLLGLWMDGFTAFSVVPLRFATWLGVFSAFIGFVFTIAVVIKKIVDPSVLLGWTSTISITLVIGGIILMMLGLIGEYLGRIYISINNSPQYVIKESTIDKD